jgi:predicted transcriptional regulator
MPTIKYMPDDLYPRFTIDFRRMLNRGKITIADAARRAGLTSLQVLYIVQYEPRTYTRTQVGRLLKTLRVAVYPPLGLDENDQFTIDFLSLVEAARVDYGLSMSELAVRARLPYMTLYRTLRSKRQHYDRHITGKLLYQLGVKLEPPFYIEIAPVSPDEDPKNGPAQHYFRESKRDT